jgi:hypothetical protein
VAITGGGGTGNVVGPASSTDNAIARFDGTTGELIQDSGITIADGASGTLSGTNSGDVTLAGSPDYLTIAAQVITRALINLTTHVTNRLPFANLVAATAASRLVGRQSGSAGDFEEITLGTNLSMSGTTLNAADTDTGITQLTGDVTAGPGSGSQAATIANDAVTYAKMQNVSAASRLLGRGSAAGAGDVEEITVGSGLAMTGTVLSSTGSSTPNPGLCDGRLTLTTAVPVTQADVTGATTVFFAPFNGSRLALFDGVSAWVEFTFTELSLALGTLIAARPYDVFVFNNAGTPTLEFLAWTNDTTRATALVKQDGVWVLTGATTRRYLGTFYTTATTTTEDSAAKRFLWNQYNRMARPMSVIEATDTWTYTLATWRQARATTTNQLDVVCGNAEDSIDIGVVASASNTAASIDRMVSIGPDSTTVPAPTALRGFSAMEDDGAGGAAKLHVWATLKVTVAVGRHFYTWMEWSVATGTTTWYGDNGQPSTGAGCVSGINAMWRS